MLKNYFVLQIASVSCLNVIRKSKDENLVFMIVDISLFPLLHS